MMYWYFEMMSVRTYLILLLEQWMFLLSLMRQIQLQEVFCSLMLMMRLNLLVGGKVEVMIGSLHYSYQKVMLVEVVPLFCYLYLQLCFLEAVDCYWGLFLHQKQLYWYWNLQQEQCFLKYLLYLQLEAFNCLWYQHCHLELLYYPQDCDFIHLEMLNDAELPFVYNQNYKTLWKNIAFFWQTENAFFEYLLKLQNNNNFIMAQNFDSEKMVNEIEKKMIGNTLMKSEEEKKREIFEYDNQQFMVPMPQPNINVTNQKGTAPTPQIKKSMVLNKNEVEKSLTEIYNYYTRVYIQPTKEYSQFDAIRPPKLDIKSFLLFAKNFKILKAIFTLDRCILIFKKHADFGKYLSFDNFYFMINSMSHETEVKTFFNLDSMLQNLDIQTIQELQKQEFYNYLQLKDPEAYRKNFTELFGSFNIKDKPRVTPLKYNYRKFSLPQLRKKALLEPRQKKKGEKDLFILKHDKEMHQNIFDEAKSIVVSWDSLRAKSVNNLGKPSDLVQKKYLKIDPQEDPYLQQVRPSSKPSPKNIQTRKNDRPRELNDRQHYGNKIQKKIKEIQQTENLKNQQILNRIQKKQKLPSSRKLQM